MAEFALRELIDEKRLQHLQNEFCKVTGVMAVGVDKEGRAITEPYIDKSLIRPDGEDPILGEYRKKAAQADVCHQRYRSDHGSRISGRSR